MQVKDKKILVALSGGVDSAVSAIKLIHHGARVTGLYIDMSGATGNAGQKQATEKLADRLGIKLITVNASHTFHAKVVERFVREYLEARTPNPCVICNPEIKFHIGLEICARYGFDIFATGHYARIDNDIATGKLHLRKGMDTGKDQSYFLHRVSATALARSIFPLGDMLKTDVIAMAESEKITDDIQPESQEICFLNDNYRAFIENQALQNSISGPVRTVDGEIKGYHKGLHRYTVGQRRGLGIPDATPYYVVRLEASSNSVIIGKKHDLAKGTLTMEDVSWISGSPPSENGVYNVKIRYRHTGAPAGIRRISGEMWQISFREPQYAVTPGQYAVVYDGDRVLGGGKICG